MAILTFPDVSVSSVEWGLVSNTQTHTSPLSGIVQTLELPGTKWQATIKIDCLTIADHRKVTSFRAALRGQAGRFYLYNHFHSTPSGVATGTPQINGAAQTGGTLLTKGWTISQTGILLAGDYIGFGDELKIVTADANSDGAGLATVSIEPPIRTSPADSASITTTEPTCIMRSVESVSSSTNMPNRVSSFIITAIEAFTA